MKLLFSLLLSFMFCQLLAQNSSNELLKQQLLKDWNRAKAYTAEYLEAMPAEKYGFRPVEGTRSFAEQMLHFAQSNAGMSFIATDIKNPAGQIFLSPNFGKSAGSQKKDSVIYYVNASYDIVINAVKNVDFAKMNEEVSWNMPGGRRTTSRLGWLLKAFEHQTHHRGQATVYFRLVGLVPPGEKLWD